MSSQCAGPLADVEAAEERLRGLTRQSGDQRWHTYEGMAAGGADGFLAEARGYR